MHLAIGERIEFHNKGVLAMLGRRIEGGKQVAHRGEPAAAPHGGNVPAIGNQRVGFDFLLLRHRYHKHLGGGLVVAEQHFLTFERPHLYGAALVGVRKPKVGAALRIGANGGAELKRAVVGRVAVKPSHPRRFLLVASRHTLNQFRHAQIVNLPHDFAVAAQRVDGVVDEEMRQVHIAHHRFLLPQVFRFLHTLNAAARNQKFLQCAAVEFVEGIALGNVFHRRRLASAAQVLGTKSAHYGFHHLAEHIVGDGRSAIFLVNDGFLGGGGAVGINGRVRPLVAVGESLVAQPAFAERGSGTPGSECRFQNSSVVGHIV